MATAESTGQGRSEEISGGVFPAGMCNVSVNGTGWNLAGSATMSRLSCTTSYNILKYYLIQYILEALLCKIKGQDSVARSRS